MPETKTLKTRGVQGSAQFLTQKKKMLQAFDSAKEEATSHETITYHGRVAEAEFRQWLTAFLPKKFGVTSGYIVSAGRFDGEKLPEFDVIIYDILESPVLWVEENRDSSAAGWKRAIPAEYVRAVIEIKSSFTPRDVKKAIDHLMDLEPLLSGKFEMDALDFTVPKFVTQIVFFELTKQFETSKTAINSLTAGKAIPGFMGGIILRGEERPSDESAIIELWNSLEHTDQQGNHVLPKSTFENKGWTLLNKSFASSENIQIGSDVVQAGILWKPSKFAMFAFDLVAMLNGQYDSRRMSSSHGLRFHV